MRTLLLLGALLSGMASAQPVPLEFYLRGNGKVFLSEARTQGGVGGGAGVRGFLSESLLLQADLGYLSQIGNVAELRLGAGWQLPGTLWRPGAAVILSTLLGDRLSFLTPHHPTPVGTPAFSLGLALSPLRFTQAGVSVSLLEVELGLGWEFPGLGLALGLTLVETSLRF